MIHELVSLGLCTGLAVGLLAPRPAAAFCGFYVGGANAKLFNDATVVVLMRDGRRTVVSMQNAYQGPLEDFALVVPVPVVLREGDVKTLRREVFDRVDTLAAPRLVEYWEQDPCGRDSEPMYKRERRIAVGPDAAGAGELGAGRVKVEARFAVAEYEVVILSARESDALEAWLHENGYAIPDGAESMLRPYVAEGMKFFVAKVDPSKVEFSPEGRAMLSPLRFHYDSDEFSLPVRLGLINAPAGEGGKQDLLVHILAPDLRYEAANYPNVTVKTNLVVDARTKDDFGGFYAALFDQLVEQHPGAVVTEYSWQAGSCDPCPVGDAPLTEQELLELGVDVLPRYAKSLEPGSGPSVSIGKPVVRGPSGHDADDYAGLNRWQEPILACYRVGLARRPQLAGELALEFEYEDSRGAVGAYVRNSTLDDAATEECIEALVGMYRPGRSEGDFGRTTLSIPVELKPRGGPPSPIANAFVLTRLHARYDATALGEDLVFRSTGPIVGGREFPTFGGEPGQLDYPSLDGRNSFQARYIIRHAWTGRINCDDPIRGKWGDRPRGTPTVARAIGSVKRGASVEQFLPSEPATSPAIATAIEAPSEPPRPASRPASRPAEPGGCGCSTGSQRPPISPPAWLVLLGLIRGRRRSRC